MASSPNVFKAGSLPLRTLSVEPVHKQHLRSAKHQNMALLLLERNFYIFKNIHKTDVTIFLQKVKAKSRLRIKATCKHKHTYI